MEVKRNPDLLIWVDRPDPGHAKVWVAPAEGVDEDFAIWMAATEYMMHITAQKSGAGYEKALELLMGGAMSWRHREQEETNGS